MPRIDIDYSKTHFYKVVCRDLNIKDCFVGYTTDFKSRTSEHKRQSQKSILNGPNSMLYYFVGQHGGWDNFQMVLIKTRECEGSLDAHRIRLEYMEEFNAKLHGPMRPLTNVKQEDTTHSNIPEQTQSKQTAQPKRQRRASKQKQSKSLFYRRRSMNDQSNLNRRSLANHQTS